MSKQLGNLEVREFLTKVGSRVASRAELVILGGSGLSLLGSSRTTVDLDFDGAEHATDAFRTLLKNVATELQIDIEAVPFDQFLPLPPGARDRHIAVGQFGPLEVLVFDPYSIALSKLDRGFDSDIEDIAFLLREGHVDAPRLESFLANMSDQAIEYDLDLTQMQRRLEVIQTDLQG